MSFSQRLLNDKRVVEFHQSYMEHPFIKGLLKGDLDRDKFRNYLIQDSLYLKEYAKVYASAFLLAERVEDLQFLHSCIGVVVSDETNMHSKYLQDYGLDVYKVDNMVVLKENRDYLDYMLSFTEGGDIKEIFMSALPCTITYEFIGKTLEKECGVSIEDNYFGPWIKTYGGVDFEKFSVDSQKLLDYICGDIGIEEEEKLIDIYLTACQHEMNFWDMSFK